MQSRKFKPALLLGGFCILSGAAVAQAPFNMNGDETTATTAVIGGQQTVDLITLRSSLPGVPLRFGGVIAGSEIVEFDGRRLTKGRDYQIDYEAGVVYLMRAQKPGQMVRVSYRYEPTKQASVVGKTQFSSLPTFKFDLVPGRVNAVVGLGMTERQADGNVLLSNVYGWNNSFGSLKGLMLVGERSSVEQESDYEYRGRPGQTDTGRSKFVLQNFATDLNGGSIEASFQDISHNFAGFGAVADSGYERAYVDQLAKEKGLKRFSLGMKDVGLGDAKLSNGFRQIRDGSASIDWRQFSLSGKQFSLDYSSQSVDQDFKRFKDLAEGDREQLKKEVGLMRQNFAAKLGSMSFKQSEVENASGEGIYRRELQLDTSKFGFSFGEQVIDRDFRRFDSLHEQERGQWGREAGLSRQWLALDTAVLGKDKQPTLRRSVLASATGQFDATDVNLQGKGWSLQHSSRNTDATFGSLGAMSEGEMDGHIRSIANMYGPGINNRPEDRGFFLRSAGIDRSLTRFGATPFKGWNLGFDHLKLSGSEGGADVLTLNAKSDKADFYFRQQRMGDQFNELLSLMQFERQQLGTISGLDRTDFGMNLNFGKSKSLKVATLDAESPTGGAKRTAIAYRDPKIEVDLNTREVDSGFSNVVQLMDPEKDLLAALRGYSQRDAKVKWQINSQLRLDAFLADAQSDPLSQSSYIRNFVVDWKPDAKTSVNVLRMQNKQSDPLQTLFSNLTEKITLARDFGRLGKVMFFNETQNFEGTNNQFSDFTRQYLAYETKLDAKTGLRTEQTRTRYQNGEQENISANTLTTEISKKVGVSVTDMRVDRTGEKTDETKRNYGFWFDFGRGMRLNYGYARAINGPTGTMNSVVNMTPGSLGFLKIDQASYAENRWDAQHTQGLSNVALSSSAPMNLGLIKNFTFNFAMDTATDWTNWVRENRIAGVAGSIGSNKIGLEYRSQMSANGYRGIDRTVTFETDQSEKRAIVGKMRYTVRDLPRDDAVMIRDLSVTLRPMKGVQLTHQMLTHPEDPQPRPDVPMFRNTNPWRVNKWTINVDQGRTGLAGSWEERMNSISKESSRMAGLTLDLFKNSGSPLQLFYGVEQRWGNQLRQTAHRYYLRFDQRPGPNQLLSVFAGNLSYEHSIANGASRNNWTVNVNYQIRF
jgi:hypothetical protein